MQDLQISLRQTVAPFPPVSTVPVSAEKILPICAGFEPAQLSEYVYAESGEREGRARGLSVGGVGEVNIATGLENFFQAKVKGREGKVCG